MKSFSDAEYTAICDSGLEQVCAEELQSLGAQRGVAGKRSVHFQGDLAVFYRINFFSRIASRILKPLARFSIGNGEQLYRMALNIPFERYFSEKQSFSIHSSVRSRLFSHSGYPVLKLKDAIVDRFREKTGGRPDVNRENPDCPLHLHIDQDQCVVSLDAHGISLQRRHYRKGTGGEAPLSEALAAGLISLSGWDRTSVLVDPMCGSGTIAIEAAMMLTERAPALLRRHFPFLNWRNADPGLWSELKENSQKGIKSCLGSSSPIIFASDISDSMVKLARENARRAGVEDCIVFEVRPFQELVAPADSGYLLFNPPYGERLALEEVKSFYKEIGDVLKKNWSGFHASMIALHGESVSSVGLRATRRIPVRNGNLDCRLLQYELYSGSREKRQ